MCVAAVVNKPISLEYLRMMEKDNPHGGGVAWYDEGLWFKKGLTADEIFTLQEEGWLTYPYLLHFRWATHGQKVPELCHPFPLGPRAIFGELEGSCSELLVHNGVWNGFTKHLGKINAPRTLIAELSDTAVAAYLMKDEPRIVDDISWATIVARDVDGKMSLEIGGTCWKQYEGNSYSNLQWLPVSNPSFAMKEWVTGWEWESPTPAPRNVPIIPTKFDWQQYIRDKYGDEAAKEAESMTEDSEQSELEKELEASWESQIEEFDAPSDLMSDDFQEVNDYLAKQYRRNYA
jgi:hypothetical protein